MERLSGNLKNKIAQGLFYVAFVMEILIMCLNSAGVTIPDRTRLMQLAALIFGIKILLTHYTKKECLMIISMCVIALVPLFSVQSTQVLEIVLMIIASKDVDRERVIKLYFGMMLTAIILMILLSTTGVIGNLALTKDYRGNGPETRYCFGYSHPNVFYSNVLKMVMAGFVVYYKKCRGWQYIAFTVINFIFYLFADSRTGFLVVELLIIAFYCLYKKPDLPEHKFVRYLGQGMIACVILLSYLLPYLPYDWIRLLDRALTGRIYCSTAWILANQWSLLPVIRDGNFVLDMGYFYLMANWGILLGIIYLLLVFYNYRLFYKNKNWSYVLVLVVYSIFTFVESHAFSMYFVGNIMFLLMLGWGTYESDEPKKQST